MKFRNSVADQAEDSKLVQIELEEIELAEISGKACKQVQVS